jgi:hypothetical protein
VTSECAGSHAGFLNPKARFDSWGGHAPVAQMPVRAQGREAREHRTIDRRVVTEPAVAAVASRLHPTDRRTMLPVVIGVALGVILAVALIVESHPGSHTRHP